MYLDTIVLYLSFSLNILLSGYGIYADNRPFSLNKIYWIFNLLFLSVVPFGQYFLGTFSWGRHFENTTLIYANVLILACNVLYSLLRIKSMKSFTHVPSPQHSFSFLNVPKTSKKLFLALFFLIAITQILLQGKGVFTRSEATLIDKINNSTIQLLLDKSLKGFLLIGTLFAVFLWRAKQLSDALFVVIILWAIIANFPLAVPRYWAATFYIAVLLTLFTSTFLKYKNLFGNFLLILIVAAFPIFSLFRYSVAAIKSNFISLKSVFQFSFFGGDFDAYTSLCSTIEFVIKNGITWGRQLATVLLFFVPRSLWQNKSVGSGALVNSLPNSDFSNFCSPFIAEGFINFGILGSLIFIASMAFFIARYDDFYWHKPKADFRYLFYPAAMGMLFFMLRGDLLSSFAYSVGIYSSGWLFYKMVVRK